MCPEITITIQKDGTTQVAVQGVTGPGCTALTAKLEAALGVVTEREHTAAYYEQAQEGEQEVGQV